MAFKIYYASGKVLKSWEMPNSDLVEHDKGMAVKAKLSFPPRGIVGIIQDDAEAGWSILVGHDYYFLDGGRWVGANLHQVIDFFIERNEMTFNKKGLFVHGERKWSEVDIIQLKQYFDDSGIVLTGRPMPGSEIDNIIQKAIYDPEFPAKTKWYMTEPTVHIRAPGAFNADETNR